MRTTQNINAILFATLALIFSSCIEDVNDKYLPKTDPKLVLFCELIQGDSIKVNVWKSTPVSYNNPVTINYEEDDVVDNATVIITEMASGNQISLPFSYINRRYELPPSAFAIENGKNYSINVSAAGLNSVYSTTSIIGGEDVEYDVEARRVSSAFDNSILFTGTINDFAGETNYYWVEAKMYYTFSNEGYYYSNNMVNSSEKVLLSDKNRDGTQIPFRVKVYDYYYGEEKENTIDSIVFSVNQIDKDYYNFLVTYVNQDAGNPFAEAEQVYSNVTFGLGIFASVRRQNYNVPLDDINP